VAPHGNHARPPRVQVQRHASATTARGRWATGWHDSFTTVAEQAEGRSRQAAEVAQGLNQLQARTVPLSSHNGQPSVNLHVGWDAPISGHLCP
jgi:hypothetical protein